MNSFFDHICLHPEVEIKSYYCHAYEDSVYYWECPFCSFRNEYNDCPENDTIDHCNALLLGEYHLGCGYTVRLKRLL